MQQGKKEGYIWTFGFNISMLALRSHHVTCDGFEMVFKGKTFVSTCSSLFFFFSTLHTRRVSPSSRKSELAMDKYFGVFVKIVLGNNDTVRGYIQGKDEQGNLLLKDCKCWLRGYVFRNTNVCCGSYH